MAAAPPQKELLYDVLDDGEEALVLKKPDVESGGGAGGKVKPKELNIPMSPMQKTVSTFHRLAASASPTAQEIKAKWFQWNEARDGDSKSLRKALGGEFLVTLLFLFTICATYINTLRSGHATSELMAVSALVTGFCSVALINTFGDVSGAHFNPAVTFGIVVAGKMSPIKGLYYVVTQLAASLAAMLLLTMVYPPFAAAGDTDRTEIPVVAHLVVQPSSDANPLRSLLMEIVLSFILVYVIFATAVDTAGSPIGTAIQVPSTAADPSSPASQQQTFMIYPAGHAKASTAPVSIGLTLGFLCFIGGSVSGGAFNPARVFGPGICAWNWNWMWLYWLGDFTGAALAGFVQTRFFSTKK